MKIDEIKGYCLHLKNSKRGDSMRRELNSFTSNWEVFDAIFKRPGYIGISESFKCIIKKAQEEGLKQILVFEDDVKFTSDKSKEQFQKCIDSLPDEWDILLGGVYSLPNKNDLRNESINGCIKKIGDFSALHCTLINESAYDMILRHNPYDRNHLDRYLGFLSANDKINIYVSYPMIAMQETDYSESGGCRVPIDYSRVLDRFEIFK